MQEKNLNLFLLICDSESWRRHEDSSEAPVCKWSARQEEWQRQWRIWDRDVSMLTFTFLQYAFQLQLTISLAVADAERDRWVGLD